MNPMQLLPLLPVISKHAATIKAVTDMLPELEALANDAEAVVQKHQGTIDKVEQLSPALQALVNDALPVIQQISPPQ